MINYLYEVKAKDLNNTINLGTGIYTVTDISFLLNIPNEKIRRWLKDYWELSFNTLNKKHKYSKGTGRDKVVNFYSLIEFYTFAQLRDMGISVKRIIEAHNVLSQNFETPYPFAFNTILSDGNTIFIEAFENFLEAKPTLQYSFKEILSDFVSKIEFNHDNLASKFYPAGKESNIVINPNNQFGQPIIDGTNILAETLYDMYKCGDSVEMLGSLYELSLKQVKDAINFFQPAA